MIITVVGAGYVGISNALILSKNHTVKLLDIDKDKIEKIKNKKSPIEEKDIEHYLLEENLNLIPTTDFEFAYSNSDYIVIAVPTNYDQEKNYFNTSAIESSIIMCEKYNKNATIVIKSTIPVHYTNRINQQFNTDRIIFSPEFLREGSALYDNLYPSRIIVGDKSEKAKIFANLLKEGAIKKDLPILLTNSHEAEAIKLFANTYLAMRVAFFNELDTYSEVHNLNSKEIIEGICHDSRIGNHYNNPSFGYGGYCLPKDTKQLLANYQTIPNRIIRAVVNANNTRKDHICEMIISKNPKLVGIYRLTMKKDSDNFRESSIQGIIDRLSQNHIDMLIYEPKYKLKHFKNFKVTNDLEYFKSTVDLIATNRMERELEDIKDIVYTRDIFACN